MTTTTTIKTTSTSTTIVRAFQALDIPLRDVQWWSCEAPVYRLPPTLPPEVLSWIGRHPEAGNQAPPSRVGRKLTTAALEQWRVRYHPSVRAVLASPAKHRADAKRSYRRALGFVG
jgi:hypothetical protein